MSLYAGYIINVKVRNNKIQPDTLKDRKIWVQFLEDIFDYRGLSYVTKEFFYNEILPAAKEHGLIINLDGEKQSSKMTDEFMNETIIFGGIPTKRIDVYRYLTDQGYDQRAIEAFAWKPKAVDMEPYPLDENPALKEASMNKKSLMALPPFDLEELSSTDTDEEILRLAIIAELDAVSLYEQMANKTKDEKIKEVLLDIAKEEKTHVGELEALLKGIDKEYVEELDAGDKEVKSSKRINSLVEKFVNK